MPLIRIRSNQIADGSIDASIKLYPGSVIVDNFAPNVSVIANGNVTATSITTDTGFFWSNGDAYATGSTYSDSNVASYLPSYSGNISANVSSVQKIYANQFYYSNGDPFFGVGDGGILSTSGPTPPTSPSDGDEWYDTGNDILYRFTLAGSSYSWVDVSSDMVVGSSSAQAIQDLTNSLNQLQADFNAYVLLHP